VPTLRLKDGDELEGCRSGLEFAPLLDAKFFFVFEMFANYQLCLSLPQCSKLRNCVYDHLGNGGFHPLLAVTTILKCFAFSEVEYFATQT